MTKSKLLICCCALFACPCAAQTYGRLSPDAETISAAGGFLADPAIAKWLMTLPETDAAADNTVFNAMLNPDPIGGKTFELIPAEQPAPPMTVAVPLQAPDALDPAPNAGKLLVERSTPRIKAADSGKRGSGPTLEGRSTSRASRPARPFAFHRTSGDSASKPRIPSEQSSPFDYLRDQPH